MKRQFKYPKHFEEQKKIPKLTQKRIQLAEISLGDFEGRLANELLNWFSLTPQHWIMLHMVMLAYYKNKSITKNQLLKVCLLYTSPSPRDRQKSRMPSSA